MTQIQIIGAIMLATGATVPDVARSFGVPKQTFYRVLSGESKNAAIRECVAELIELPVIAIWPETAREGD